VSYSLDVKVLGLPTPERNARRHWKPSLDEKLATYDAIEFAVLGKRPVAPLMRARVVFTRHSATRPDPTNLVESWKYAEDGLVRSGILVNDKAENYVGEAPDYCWEPAPMGHGFITIHVEEEGSADNGEKEDHIEEGSVGHVDRPGDREGSSTQ